MRLLLSIVFGLILMKLSWDDLKTLSVRSPDLIVLNGVGLMLFHPEPLWSWGVKLALLIALGWIVHQAWMGDGDLEVLSALSLICTLDELRVVLQVAATAALLFALRKEKAAQALPFVPFMGLGMMAVYLIRLRLIFS